MSGPLPVSSTPAPPSGLDLPSAADDVTSATITSRLVGAPGWMRLGRNRVAVAAVVLLSVLAVAALVHRPDLYRAQLSLLLLLDVLVLLLARPRAGLLVLFIFMPFLGFVRRVLIAPSGWPSVDPLVLIAPAVATILFVLLFGVQRRRLTSDALSVAMAALLGLTMIQAANITGAGAE